MKPKCFSNVMERDKIFKSKYFIVLLINIAIDRIIDKKNSNSVLKKHIDWIIILKSIKIYTKNMPIYVRRVMNKCIENH